MTRLRRWLAQKLAPDLIVMPGQPGEEGEWLLIYREAGGFVSTKVESLRFAAHGRGRFTGTIRSSKLLDATRPR